jgi:hypothetical protein
MKKVVFLIFFLAAYYIYSDEDLNFNLNLATTGAGLNYASNDDKDNVELFAEILTVGIKHNDTNITIGFSPVKYWYYWRGDEPDTSKREEKLSFLNLNIGWDLLINRRFFLGPFCSINYIFLENSNMKWNKYILTGGMRFLWIFNILKKENVLSNFISSDVGYRIIDGKSNFHFSISVDIITLCYSIGIIYGEYKPTTPP